MKLKQKIILSIIVFSFLLIGHQSLASTTDGTIDNTYRYAWGENVGFIDFGSTSGNVHITDTALSGYAYGENIGFINLSTIINDNEGDLSGYAWGENVGFIDFRDVSIDENGVFTGQAYGENIGFITFGTTNNKVVTDWRPESTRGTNTQSTRRSTGSLPVVTTVTPVVTNPLNNQDNQAPSNPTRTLRYGMTGDDVKALQVYLNTHNYPVSTIGPGSLNHETTYFGLKTKQAVIKFQLANKLIGDGIVGPLTRALLK